MRALFFAPHAAIWVHAFPEALVAEALRASGHDIIYVTCDGALSTFCIAMGARGLTPETPAEQRSAVCRACRQHRDHLRDGFGFAGYDFESVLTPADERRLGELLAGARPQTIADFVVDGIAVGRATLYEYLIANKKSHLALADEEWPAFRLRLANTLRSLLAAERILEQEQPQRVVTYNTLYSVNAMWRAVAERRGIATYFLHAGGNLKDRLRTLMIGRDSTLAWYAHLVDAWRAYRDVPCRPAELAAVTDHFEQLFRGTSVFAYSAAKSPEYTDVRTRFRVGDRRLLLATMSSYDEYVAAAAIGEMPSQADALFPTQIEWIRAVAAWVRTRPELFLIVRVHPREFPNKREGKKSEHARALEQALAELPSNACVNWPTDELSIYDLAEHVDVVLNAWSSAGKEMALLGIPVVVYCPEMLLYPADLSHVGTTHGTYFAAIERALAEGWSFERVRRAYRWCVLELVRGVVDIGDGFAFSEDPPRSLGERACRAVLAAPGVRARWDLWRRPHRLRTTERITETIVDGRPTLLPRKLPYTAAEELETLALRRELRRLANALYHGGVKPPVPGRLRAHLLKHAL